MQLDGAASVLKSLGQPIPSFYCCYVLRSRARRFRDKNYVGSTPCMPRRLKQHNGITKGGAKLTSTERHRPWEVACMVHGFPSKIAALQFESALQNADITRHIPQAERITASQYVINRKRDTQRRKRPTMSLKQTVYNIHLLLCSQTFRRWPLKLRFFSNEVHNLWHDWAQRYTGETGKHLEVTTDVVEWPSLASEASAEPASRGSVATRVATPQVPAQIQHLDTRYLEYKTHLEKAVASRQREGRLSCSVCGDLIGGADPMIAVCPHQGCLAISHIRCLSKEFLRQESQTAALVPTTGRCPGCGTTTQWATLMTELSLRIRGKVQLDKIFKVGKRNVSTEAAPTDDDDDAAALDDDNEDPGYHDIDEYEFDDDDADDDDDDDDARSIRSEASGTASVASGAGSVSRGNKKRETRRPSPIREAAEAR